MSSYTSNIVYLSFGRGPHQDETVYSILTLQRFPESELRGIRPIVISDQVDHFAGFGIQTLAVPTETMTAWKGAHNMWSRPKILALTHAAEHLQGTSVMVDGDTVFRRPPRQVFDRVGPGRSVLHMPEGYLGLSRVEGLRRAGEEMERASPVMSDGRRLGNGRRTLMWNAGVIGISPEDRPLLQEVLAFTDAMVQRFYLSQWEQIGFAVVQAAATRLQPARDVVSHYCVSPERKAFRARLGELLGRAMRMPPHRRAAFLYEHRIRIPRRTRMRVLAKDVANATGVVPLRDRFDCL